MHICGTFMNALDLVVSYECMYAGESSTNFICECTLILFADTMKRNFQGVDDDQGSEYLKCSFLRLQNRYRIISNSEICTWIQIRTDLVSFQFQPKYSARHFSDEQNLFKLEQAGMLRDKECGINIFLSKIVEVENVGDHASVAEVLVFDLVLCYPKYILYCIR